MSRRVYRLLGGERFPLTKEQIEQLVRDGILSLDTKIWRDGEAFAAALGSRAEFQHLVPAGRPAKVKRRGGAPRRL